jgi:hypothetical protein
MDQKVRGFVQQPRPRKARHTHWMEKKSCRSLNLTDTCWELLTAMADKEGCNRSEWIERHVRSIAVDELDGLNNPV